VVLIVMVALLGLGMTGLFLTSSSIQMNTNINLRNQAIVVAEAGLERARGILNDKNSTPSLPALLAGSNPGAGDDVPISANACDGIAARGAVLVDSLSAGCTAGPTFCKLQNVNYPTSINRSSGMPAASGTVVQPTMGQYTVYIRQDQADCRMGNFVCDNATSSADGGVVLVPCVPPAGAPPPNGAVVVRSEGVASDGRTRVVLEVTMAPNSGAIAWNTPLSALCAAGANGCDDNSSVQSGIVVNSGAPQTPPSNGGSGAGGATSAGGAGGSGTTTPIGGIGAGGAVATGGVVSTGGSGSGGAHGTGGSSGCVPSACPSLATMGVFGNDPVVNFKIWLADHSSSCLTQDLAVDTNVITAAMLAPYKIVIVLDVGHSQQDYDTFNATSPTNLYGALLTLANPSPPVRQFSAAEGQVVKQWVQNGGGIFVVNGYNNSLWLNTNFNTLIEPLGLVYYSPSCDLDPNCPKTGTGILYQSQLGQVQISSFATHPLTVGVTQLFADGWWPISGYPVASGLPTALDSRYKVWATYGNGENFGVAGTYGAGRVVVIADEWVTFDKNWASSTWGSSVAALWNNAITWLGNCSGAPPSSFPDPNTWYKICTSASPSQCLDVSGGNYSNGDAIQLWTKTNVNQEFQFEDAGNGYYTITCRGNTSYSIDMSGNFANGQKLKLWSTDVTNANQKFNLVALPGGNYRLESSNPGYSIDDSGSTGNGTKPYLWSSDSNNGNQQWVITAVP
jgi:Tfp pilus assembly protein PilX